MKSYFFYSTDLFGMNTPELAHTCMHLLCTEGEGSFVFNDRSYPIAANDLVVVPNPNRVKDITTSNRIRVEWFAADYKFLQSLLPSNNYSIGGSISLNQNPVIHLNDKQAARLLDDFHRLRDRLADRQLRFYREMMGSLCLTMMYDIFEAHASDDSNEHSDRVSIIVRQFMQLLSTGISRTRRDVSYYAERLHVSPKYLSATVKRVTGHSVSHYIHRSTIPIIKRYLNDERLSLTQIAERMNFSSLPHFSRYCKKNLGQSPSDYRHSLQPKAH